MNFKIEDYKNKYEPAAHWELKKEFMLNHMDRFEETRLVCLATSYVNYTILGCTYPPEVMKQLKILGEGLGEKYRSGNKNKLKRTLVGASDAAKSKVRRVNISYSKEQSSVPQSNTAVALKNSIKSVNPSDKLVLCFNASVTKSDSYIPKSRAVLNQSAARCKMALTIVTFLDGYHVVRLGDVIVHKVCETSNCANLNKKALEESVFRSYLTEKCKSSVLFLLKRQKHGNSVDTEDLKSNCEYIEAEGFTEMSLFKENLDESNIGTKIMKKMGWGNITGQGIGKDETGDAAPIVVIHCVGRRGLGYNADETNRDFRSNIDKIIREYANNMRSCEKKWDLVFSPNFTKSQRAVIHNFLKNYPQLKHVSYGTEERRYLVISSKMSVYEEIQDKLIGGNETEDYKIYGPGEYDLSIFGFDL